MIIPEVIIYNTLSSFQKIISSDYESKSNKDDSILAKLFKNDDNGNRIIMSDYDYYKQAVAILNRTDESQRKLHFNIGYNMQRVSVPTIHILMPNENKGRIDTVGHSEETSLNEAGDIANIQKTRSNSSTYYLMITSDNSSEVMIIYYWLKAMFLLFHENLELLGLMNLNHSGQDLNLQQDLAPPNIFHRNLSLSFDYESSVNINVDLNIINGIKIGICDNFQKDVNDYINNHKDEA